MFGGVISFVRSLFGRKRDRALPPMDHRTATIALLLSVARIDGREDKAESGRLEQIVCREYGLSPREVRGLIAQASIFIEGSVDLFDFTQAISRTLDRKERQNIIFMLWEVVCSDGLVHEFEDNLIWRTAELLGVSPENKVLGKEEVLPVD